MKKVIKFTPIFVVSVLIAFVFWLFASSVKYNATADTIHFIAEHFNNRNEIVDYYNEIGVKSIDDIHFIMKGQNVTIQFGKLKLDWKLKNFVKEENQKLLKTIHIEIFKDKTTGELRLFYKGEEIERWVS